MLDLVEQRSHLASIVSDSVGYTIGAAELRGEVNRSSLSLDDEHRLSLVSNLHPVLLQEVLGDGDLLSISLLHEGVTGTLVKRDFIDDVDPSYAIVSYHTLLDNLISALGLEDPVCDLLLVLMLVVDLVVDVMDLFEDGCGGEEATTIVYDERATIFVLIGRGFKSIPDLHVHISDRDRLSWVKEARTLPDLDETCLTHGLLHDDIEDLRHGEGVLPLGIVDVFCVDDVLTFLVDHDENS